MLFLVTRLPKEDGFKSGLENFRGLLLELVLDLMVEVTLDFDLTTEQHH
jgi:hypothetical protein